MNALRHLYLTGEHSDMTIICCERKWRVHKCIMSASSGYFKRLCSSTHWKETKDGIITLEGVKDSDDQEDFTLDQPDMVEAMLQFIYTGSYRVKESAQGIQPKIGEAPMPTISHTRATEHDFSSHARLFSIACKYDIPCLRDQAVAAYNASIIFTKVVLDTDLAKAILIAFGTGSDAECQMRDCVFNTLVSRVRSAMKSNIVVAAIEKSDGVALRLVKALVDQMPGP
ncbi:uncharacterized protein K489DRAFT_381432 [Dissoconium aciculare CBS 342.82]|uniref:BTB domain-containing protein n=1 Tax=Dissoconium aciculare CBS 342.82 TaxID=1314786 RepID=A0A6J3M083_9PEZI|nr:uncharacterized protein K489DRAFT_381432 [Dissoconium aciculare CBS 342.82]KAF1821440.1 hypothetical protein K489DRAFT_381432 [Dissoconium aciculare CBS 342.82]